MAFLVMTPMHRQLNAITAWSIEMAHQAGLPFVWYPHPGDALIGRARSIMATHFLERTPYQCMVMIDSDISFQPSDLGKLFDDLDKGYELIGGVYTVRGAQQLAHYGIGAKTLIDGNIQEVAYLSTGFLGINRILLEKMRDQLSLPLCHPDLPMFRCYPFFEDGAHLFEGQWIYRSEDWDFCDKARAVNVRPMLDTSIRLGHEGTKVWTIADLPKGAKQEVKQVGETTPRHPPNKRRNVKKN